MTEPTDVTARAAVEVAVDPSTAFKVFTEEMETWWARGPANFYDGARAVGKRIEPGLGGRYMEVYDSAAGDVLEIGRITAWEPGERFVYESLLDDTEVEFTFTPTDTGTRVAVEHRVIVGGPFGRARPLSGWENILSWFAGFAEGGAGNGRVASPDLPRLSPLLFYTDLPEAVAWLERVFGLESRGLLPGGSGSVPELAELALGDSVLMCRRAEQPPTDTSHHMVWAYVDDLDAHHAQAVSEGATIIHEIAQHGDRTYVACDHEGHQWTFAQARPTQRVLRAS
jgi:uncharacterized glyoxalase superfamily protein PhnB/uncharacterized protein YndB with AHSA1/START domain